MGANLRAASKHPKADPSKSIYYPDTDGKPMGESDLHRDIMFRIIHLLQRYFTGQQVYVTGNLLLYYEEGNPRKVIVPDCFVVWGVAPHRRLIFKLWEEAQGPKVVFEVSSKTTRRTDLGSKMRLYAQLGIEEYYLYDPTQDYLDPPLAAFRLVGGGYVPMEPENREVEIGDFTLPPGHGEPPAFISPRLGLRLFLDEEKQLQFMDVISGQRILSDEEAWIAAEKARLEAETARRQAEQARVQAESENARLRAELARLRGANGESLT